MKKSIYTTILTLFVVITSVSAQSFKTLSKVQKAIVSVNTYDKNGDLLHSGTAFFIDKDGVAIADYSLFKDAYKATVIDMAGKTYNVDCILGANDTYSVVRFKVDTKGNASLNLSEVRPENGSTVFVVPFSKEKLKTCMSTTVEGSSPIMEKYSYYTLSKDLGEETNGLPMFNDRGELVGIVQPSVKERGYALDIKYKEELVIKAIASNASTVALNGINIPKGLPETLEESLVYAYFKSRSAGNDEYIDIMNRFVATFPNNPEGYLRRSVPLIDMQRFDEANADLEKYYNLSTDKAVANYSIAQSIHNKLTFMPKPEYEAWTYDKALEYIDKSVELYKQNNDTAKFIDAKILKAQIHSGKQDFDSAIKVYDELLTMPGTHHIAAFYAKSLACEARGDSLTEVIALMDSAIAQFSDPLPREAANYVLRRGQLYNNAGKPRNAVLDYNQYCYLVNNQVSDVFYYDRSQIEVRARMFQQAFEDINSAINIKPQNLDYRLEKAGLCLRFNYLDDCINECNIVLSVIPDDVTALRILGYAQINKGDKTSARLNLQKAIDLGDETAKEIMQQFLK